MAGIASFDGSACSSATSGIGSLHHRPVLGLVLGLSFGGGLYDTGVKARFEARIRTRDRLEFETRSRDRAFRRVRWRQNLAVFVDFQLRYFRLDLSFKFVRSAAKLIERLANLASDFRQLLGPKNDQGQKK